MPRRPPFSNLSLSLSPHLTILLLPTLPFLVLLLLIIPHLTATLPFLTLLLPIFFFIIIIINLLLLPLHFSLPLSLCFSYKEKGDSSLYFFFFRSSFFLWILYYCQTYTFGPYILGCFYFGPYIL